MHICPLPPPASPPPTASPGAGGPTWGCGGCGSQGPITPCVWGGGQAGCSCRTSCLESVAAESERGRGVRDAHIPHVPLPHTAVRPALRVHPSPRGTTGQRAQPSARLRVIVLSALPVCEDLFSLTLPAGMATPPLLHVSQSCVPSHRQALPTARSESSSCREARWGPFAVRAGDEQLLLGPPRRWGPFAAECLGGGWERVSSALAWGGLASLSPTQNPSRWPRGDPAGSRGLGTPPVCNRSKTTRPGMAAHTPAPGQQHAGNLSWALCGLSLSRPPFLHGHSEAGGPGS